MAEYKIKDLEQLTGIKAHTIRMWEKRYGILNPERTETQIRTYCDKELVSLLNVALLNKNGLKISRIAEMSEKQIIEWDVEKTNSDYIYEIKSAELKARFEYLSYLYNYMWYGEFAVSIEDFEKAKKAFETTLKSIY